jgi:hypothetical protein
LKDCCGKDEIDARCCRLPPNHGICLFAKGILSLSRVTDKEHAQIASFILGIIIGIQLPDGHSSGRLLRVVRGVLDFFYLAQYPMLYVTLTHDRVRFATTYARTTPSFFFGGLIENSTNTIMVKKPPNYICCIGRPISRLWILFEVVSKSELELMRRVLFVCPWSHDKILT